MELNSILNSAFIKPMFNKLKKTMIEKQLPPILVRLQVEGDELKIDILETGSIAVKESDLQALAENLERLKRIESQFNNQPPAMPLQAENQPQI